MTTTSNKLTKVSAITVITENNYKSISQFKKDKKTICEKYDISDSEFMLLKLDIQSYFKGILIDKINVIKSNIFSYENILNITFESLKSNSDYSQYCNIITANNLTVTEFVQKFYSYISLDGDILAYTKKVYKCKDNFAIVSIFVAKEILTDKFAISVLKNCFSNFAKVLTKKEIFDKDYSIANKYAIDSVKCWSTCNSKLESNSPQKGIFEMKKYTFVDTLTNYKNSLNN